MPVPHPLNQTVVTQALHDLHNGRLHRCLAMGFGERDLEALKQPALVALLVNARVPWCTVTVNQEADADRSGSLQDRCKDVHPKNLG
jgi:hypothetical protein